MDPASTQQAGSGVNGNPTPLQVLPSLQNQTAVPSLLDKINSHQFDAVTTQINDISPKQPPFQSTATMPIIPDQSSTQNSFPPPKNPLNVQVSDVQTDQPSVSTVEEVTTAQPPTSQTKTQNLLPSTHGGISPFPGQTPVTIEYPGEITQQPRTQQPSQFSTEITLPTIADTRPPSSLPQFVQGAQMENPPQQTGSPSMSSIQQIPNLPQFGSPFASIQQSIIPPLKPVVNDTPTINTPIQSTTPAPFQQTLTTPPINNLLENGNNFNAPIQQTLQSTEVNKNITNIPTSAESVERFEKKKTTTFLIKIFQSLTTAALTFQGLRGLYSSLHFIIVEFPIFEQALNEHQLGEETVNTFAIKAGLMILSTAVSLFFAVQLAIFRNKTVKILNIIIGLVVTVISVLVMHYAQNIHILDVLPNLL